MKIDHSYLIIIRPAAKYRLWLWFNCHKLIRVYQPQQYLIQINVFMSAKAFHLHQNSTLYATLYTVIQIHAFIVCIRITYTQPYFLLSSYAFIVCIRIPYAQPYILFSSYAFIVCIRIPYTQSYILLSSCLHCLH